LLHTHGKNLACPLSLLSEEKKVGGRIAEEAQKLACSEYFLKSLIVLSSQQAERIK
jgi:hypothetical protein